MPSTPKSAVTEAIIEKNLKINIDIMPQKVYTDYDNILKIIVRNLIEESSMKPQKFTMLIDEIINIYKGK